MKLKNILLSSLVFGGLMFSSCTGFLDEDSNPNTLSPSVFWKNESDIEKGLVCVYAALQPNQAWAAPFKRHIVIDCYRSDLLRYRPDVGSWGSLANFTNTSTNGTAEGEWKNCYKGISYANQCLDNIPNVPENSSDVAQLKKQAMAEARFLRAYYYFRLYRNWGERIPMFTKQIEGKDEEFNPAQANEGEILKLIETDMIACQDDLPESYPAEYAGRVTKYTAAAMLGRFYMFTHQMKKAEDEFAKVIKSGRYELMENYEDNFDGLHKNNKESLFEVQFSGDRTGGRSEYHWIMYHLCPLDAPMGGYEEAYPSQWFFDMMKKNELAASGEHKYSQRMYATLLFNDEGCSAFYFDEGKHFLDYHQPKTYYWKKYVSWNEDLIPDPDRSAFNVMIMRYSDVLLSYAECLNDRNATAEAIDYINIVRKRANVKLLDKGMSKDAVLKHLQDVERPAEFALEGTRWYDLLRWGITEKALKDHNKEFVENYIDSKHRLLPIPHSEFLLNPDWVQNPNHGK